MLKNALARGEELTDGQRAVKAGSCKKAETLCIYPKTSFKFLPHGGPWHTPARGTEGLSPHSSFPCLEKAALAPTPSFFPEPRHWSFPSGSCLAITRLSCWKLAGMTCSRDPSDLVKISQWTRSYYRGTDGRSCTH